MKRIIVVCLTVVLISTILESCASSSRSGCPTTNPNYFRGRR